MGRLLKGRWCNLPSSHCARLTNAKSSTGTWLPSYCESPDLSLFVGFLLWKRPQAGFFFFPRSCACGENGPHQTLRLSEL